MALILLALASAVVATALYFRAERLHRQLADSERQQDLMNDEHAVLSKKFNEFVAVLKDADNDSINLLNWQIQNCRYAQVVADQAGILRARYATHHEQSVAEFSRLIRDIEDHLRTKEEL